MKTLVLGASDNVQRYSNMAVRKLLSYKHEVVAIGAKVTSIEGITVNKDPLSFEDIHTVTLYLNPKRQEDYYQYVIDLDPQRVIFNPGTENPVFYELLKSNGIFYEEACTLVLLNTNQY